MEVLNPLARDYKSIGTLRKELAGLQEELNRAHEQVCRLSVEQKIKPKKKNLNNVHRPKINH